QLLVIPFTQKLHEPSFKQLSVSFFPIPRFPISSSTDWQLTTVFALPLSRRRANVVRGVLRQHKEKHMKISGVLAWHPHVAMTQEEIDEFLSGRWIARLATNGQDGYPHIAPLWYYWDGECIYFALTRNRRSCKNLRRNPRCSVVVDMDERPLMGMR